MTQLTKRELFAAISLHAMLSNSEITKVVTGSDIPPEKLLDMYSKGSIIQADDILAKLNSTQ